MWDTRSIIVRFRRQRGNTCLPGEPKPNVKKVKEEPSNASQAKEQKVNNNEKKTTQQDSSNGGNRLQNNAKTQGKQNSQTQQQSTDTQSSQLPASVTSVKTAQQQPWVYITLFFKNIISCAENLIIDYFSRHRNHRKYLQRPKHHLHVRQKQKQCQKQ